MRIRYWSSDVCSSDLAFQRVRDLGVAGLRIAVFERPEPATVLGDAGMPEDGVESGRGRVRGVVVPVVLHRCVELVDGESRAREFGRAARRDRVCQYV